MSLIPFFFGNQSGLIDPFSAILGPFSSAYPASGEQQASPLANFRVDWKETPEAHVFKAELPGLPKGDVKVEVDEEQKVLQIAGDWTKEEEKKDERWHRVERCRGKFLRRFRLPDNAKLSEVKANMDNGVLTVVVPKAVPKQPETKQIEVSGGEGEPKPEA